MIFELFFFIVGLILLFFGANYLVNGSGSIALRFGIAPLIVGCTVVAFGTSAPELVVSLIAILQENDDVSVGNIIGSNIANLALILGVAAMIRPIEVQSAVIRREYPVMAAASLFLIFLAYDGVLSRTDGAAMLVAMACYIAYMIFIARLDVAAGNDPDIEMPEVDPNQRSAARDIVDIVVGVAGLALGAHTMVSAAVTIATELAVPQLIIGISVVAIGTSLPELATSTVAAYKGESDLSVGNVVGSNVFNVLLVLGTVAAIAGVTVGPAAIEFDMWIMLAVTVLVWPLMWTGMRLTRVEGAGLLIGYFAYMIWLFLR